MFVPCGPTTESVHCFATSPYLRTSKSNPSSRAASWDDFGGLDCLGRILQSKYMTPLVIAIDIMSWTTAKHVNTPKMSIEINDCKGTIISEDRKKKNRTESIQNSR